jgi:hypothetical protein
MEEWLRDPQMLREVLLRRTLRAMITAAGVLTRAARGHAFGNDEQRWACLQLIRLAPALVGWYEPEEEGSIRDLFHPSLTEEQKDFYEAEAKKPPETREEVADSWATTFRESGPSVSFDYKTEEEARQFGRDWYDRCQECDEINLRAFAQSGRKRRRCHRARRR